MINEPLLYLVMAIAGALGIGVGIFSRYYRPSEDSITLDYRDKELDDFSEPVEPVQDPRETPVKRESEEFPPDPIPEPLPPKKPDMLETFCLAIRDFEGKPGDANYRNNNPGNFKCSPVGYAAKYGKVRCSPGGFAIFPTYELGWLYLLNSVRNRAKKHPEWTIRDFFYNYAPPADHNPTEKYAQFVARRCGVAVDTRLADLFV